MISHILPLLVATAGIGANARALPVAQGVTELISPGSAPGQCAVTAARTFGVAIAPVGAAPLRKRQDVTQIADGQLQAIGNAGFVGDNVVEAQAANAAGVFAQGAITPDIANIAAANVLAPQNIASASASISASAGLGSTQIYGNQIQVPGSVAQAQAFAGPSAYQIYDGQIQVPGLVPQAQVFPGSSVYQINDGQIQAPGFINQIQDVTPINQIYDGQVQAFASQPLNQFETLAPINQFETLAPVNQIYDGQIQAPGFINQIQDVTPINQIYDGQVQAFASQPLNRFETLAPINQFETLAPINQIYDGQIQAFAQVPEQFGANTLNVAPAGLDLGTVTQIYDGQIQAPALVAQAQAQAFGPIPQAYNAQVQTFDLAPEILSVPEVVCAPDVVCNPQEAVYTTNQVTQIMDGQIQAAAEVVQQPAQISQDFIVPQSPSALVPQSPVIPMTQIADGQVQFAKRQNGVPAVLSLDNGVLTDNLGRTGYIASNRQLQFDAPPQGGAIFTAGFSACNDGALALGGSKTFYACGSSDFNNIYDRAIHENNCTPVQLMLN